VLYERVIVATVVTEDVPRLADGEWVEVESLAMDCRRVRIRYGFMERPDVPAVLERAHVLGPDTDLSTASCYLSRETLIPSARRDLSVWREQIFIFLSGVALSPSDFFCLPHDRVVEVGTQVEI